MEKFRERDAGLTMYGQMTRVPESNRNAGILQGKQTFAALARKHLAEARGKTVVTAGSWKASAAFGDTMNEGAAS